MKPHSFDHWNDRGERVRSLIALAYRDNASRAIHGSRSTFSLDATSWMRVDFEIVAEEFLYLTTSGRTTGAERQIEIWFVEREGHHYVVAEMRERAGWIKNLMKEPRVAFSVGTRDARTSVQPLVQATARILRDEADGPLAAVKALMSAKYGWSDGLVVELAKKSAE